MTNEQKFLAALTAAYIELFKRPDYNFAAARHTPESLAVKITNGLKLDDVNKDGEGIKRACKECGIKHTYTAIREYLNG